MRSFISLAGLILRGVYQSVPIPGLCQRLRAGEDISLFDAQTLADLLNDDLQEKNLPQIRHDINAFLQELTSRDWERTDGEQRRGADFFQVLRYFSDCMIQCRQEKYLFDYRFTDIWRDYTRQVDEDMVICAAVYTDDMRRRCRRRKFDWAICAEHNNQELRTILNRGMAENHFHLRGSSSYFYLSWISLMNDVTKAEATQQLAEMERRRLNNTLGTVQDFSLIQMWSLAAAIRLYLYACIHHLPIIMDGLFLPMGEFKADLDAFHIGCKAFGPEDREPEGCIPFEDAEVWYMRSNAAYARFVEKTHRCYYAWLMRYLDSENDTVHHRYALQRAIDRMRTRFAERHVLDYANAAAEDCKYRSFSGERAIEYHSLRMIYQLERGYEPHKNLLFLYLLMKQRFHMELIQTNARSGFYNFMEYQNRKDYFITWNLPIEQMLSTDAITSVLECSGMKSVELRISPPSNVSDGVKKLQCYTRAIQQAKAYTCSDCRFHFTFHFVKHSFRSEQAGLWGCRLMRQRREYYRRAQILMDIRREYPEELGKYMLGIDACGEEIDCRPEVFAVVFRLLQYYEKRNHEQRCIQMQPTYHVGEDNYDLLDALRAIDEAVLFLDMRQGARLGHATLLGVKPQYYYQNRFQNEISLPKEVFLDNIVWMKMYLQRRNIHVTEHSALMQFIHDEFEKLFHDIYGRALQELNVIFPEMTGLSLSARDMMNDYYHAWLLRGDDPELYNDTLKFSILLTESEEYRICNSIPEIRRARSNLHARMLYYLYHYHKHVREVGMQSYKIRIPSCYIEAVERIQKHMRMKLTHQGISIETNPSSNVFIGPLDCYGEHPISVFYDNFLESEHHDVQMNVSVNTDDKSLFSTCLPNEYAYLAYSLEQETNPDGSKKYKHFDVFRWMDEIRVMGLEQSFSCTADSVRAERDDEEEEPEVRWTMR